MDRLAAMACFVRVIEAGGFSAVARERRTTQSAISKQVAALERHLGVRLLNRTTRALSLTEEGRRYLESAERIVREAEELETHLKGGARSIRGKLRIGASVAFGRLVLFDIARSFMEAHPEVELDIQLADHFVDLVSEGLDLAVRVGELPDSTLIAQRVGTVRRAVLASRDYVRTLREQGALPSSPADLAHHNCLLYTGLSTGNHWQFEAAGKTISVKVSGRLSSNSSEIMRRGLLEGQGLAFVPTYLFHRELASGEVVRLLPDHTARSLPIHVVYPTSRRNSSKVTAFVDAVREHLEQTEVMCA